MGNLTTNKVEKGTDEYKKVEVSNQDNNKGSKATKSDNIKSDSDFKYLPKEEIPNQPPATGDYNYGKHCKSYFLYETQRSGSLTHLLFA